MRRTSHERKSQSQAVDEDPVSDHCPVPGLYVCSFVDRTLTVVSVVEKLSAGFWSVFALGYNGLGIYSMSTRNWTRVDLS